MTFLEVTMICAQSHKASLYAATISFQFRTMNGETSFSAPTFHSNSVLFLLSPITPSFLSMMAVITIMAEMVIMVIETFHCLPTHFNGMSSPKSFRFVNGNPHQ